MGLCKSKFKKVPPTGAGTTRRTGPVQRRILSVTCGSQLSTFMLCYVLTIIVDDYN